MRKALIIQTAFLGDVVLATPLIEKLRATYPRMEIDFLLKKENRSLLDHHPHLRKILLFDRNQKVKSLWDLIAEIRSEKYDLLINLQRFFSSGLLSALSGSTTIVGFDKNPFSFFFHKKYAHRFEPESMLHDVERNLTLLSEIVDDEFVRPKLYPTEADYNTVDRKTPYVCMAPASVWFTKQWPPENWVKLMDALPPNLDILLVGSPKDESLCSEIMEKSNHPKVENFAGKYSLLQVAALFSGSRMNYVNDSAPLHIASAMNAPVTAIYCSTIPGFGFYPLSDDSYVAQTHRKLSCRPCGIHGRRKCPEDHFSCTDIDISTLVSRAE